LLTDTSGVIFRCVIPHDAAILLVESRLER